MLRAVNILKSWLSMTSIIFQSNSNHKCIKDQTIYLYWEFSSNW